MQAPDPSPDPVNGAELLNEIAGILQRYVVLPESSSHAIGLWVLFSYTFEVQHIAPILAIVSPEKRCGKTTLIEILCSLVPKPLPASNTTPAATFRRIEKDHPTLILDEADTFMNDRPEFAGILNSGYTKTMAWVERCEAPSFNPRRFSTWCPKVIARIGELSNTLMDRSIVIRMQRKTPGEHVERLRHDRLHEDLSDVRAEAARFANDAAAVLRDADPEIPLELDDRAQDNWRPLIAIGELAGGGWSERAREAAIALNSSRNEADGSEGVMLLTDIRAIWRPEEQRLTSQTIVDRLCDDESRPWIEWRNGRRLTPPQLATLLKRFRIGPKQMKFGGKPLRGYEREQFADAFLRYLPPEPVPPVLRPKSGLSVTPESVPQTVPIPATRSHSKTEYRVGTSRPIADSARDSNEVPVVPTVASGLTGCGGPPDG